MKNRAITVALLLTVALAAFMLILSCGTGPQNVNQNQNQNQNRAETESQTAALGADGVCDLTDLRQKIDGVKRRILEKMSDDLKKQHNGNTAQGLPPRFQYEVRLSPNGNYLEVYFENGFSGSDGLKDMADVLNDFKKDKCLLKVYFVPRGGIPVNGTARTDGFEWTACEWPKVACPSGVCDTEPCPSFSPPTANSNANTNSNTSNMNSNSGRGNANN